MKYWRTRETLAEVRGDRRLDDLARGLGHETAHGGELTNLLRRAAGAGVGHDVDRVEARLDDLFARSPGSMTFSLPMSFIISLGDLVGDAGPDVDDLVVALAVGDETFLVLIDDALRPRPAPR